MISSINQSMMNSKIGSEDKILKNTMLNNESEKLIQDIDHDLKTVHLNYIIFML